MSENDEVEVVRRIEFQNAILIEYTDGWFVSGDVNLVNGGWQRFHLALDSDAADFLRSSFERFPPKLTEK